MKHVEEKVNEIDKLVLEINHKEEMYITENEKYQESQRKLLKLKKDLMQAKIFKYVVY